MMIINTLNPQVIVSILPITRIGENFFRSMKYTVPSCNPKLVKQNIIKENVIARVIMQRSFGVNIRAKRIPVRKFNPTQVTSVVKVNNTFRANNLFGARNL